MRFLLPSLCVAALTLAGCSAETANEGQLESDATVSTVVLGGSAGATTSKQIAVSGQERMNVPSTYNWSCGRSTSGYVEGANVKWVELKNPTSQTLGVSVSLQGLDDTRPTLYAYATKDASLYSCTTFGTARALSGERSVVIEPNASAYLLVAVSGTTGVYTVEATTEHAVDTTTPDPSITLSASAGGAASTAVAISGASRMNVPSTYNWSCGRSTSGYVEGANVAWVELKNPSAQTLSVSIELDGLPETRPTLYAFANKDASLYSCTTFGTSRALSGDRSVVIEPNESAFVLVSVFGATGIYTLNAKTDATVEASSLEVTPTVGATSSTAVAMTGASRMNVPSTYNWSCGRSTSGYVEGANVAWVELKNPSAQTIAVSLQLDGLPESRPTLYAYASKDDSLYNCTTFGTSRALSGERSVIIEPNESAHVLVAVSGDTGLYTLTATTDSVIEP